MTEDASTTTFVATTRSHTRGPRTRVWDLIRDPRANLVLVPECIDATYQDDTRGVGEVQVFVYDLGDGVQVTRRSEVIEYDEGRRAVTRAMEEPHVVTETTVGDEDENGRVIISHTQRVVVPWRRPPATTARLRAEFQAELDEGGARLPLLLDR